MLLRSSAEKKNDVRFTMVSLGYKNNAVAGFQGQQNGTSVAHHHAMLSSFVKCLHLETSSDLLSGWPLKVKL